jgi:hypothetical protein
LFPSKNFLDFQVRSQTLSSEIDPVLWAGWDTSIWSLSGEVLLADWDVVLERVTLASLVGLVAFLHGRVSLGLVTSWLVAVKSSIGEWDWTTSGADRVAVSNDVRTFFAFWSSQTWSSAFATISTELLLTSGHSSTGWNIALFDGSLGFFTKRVVTLDEGGEGAGFSDRLKKSSLLFNLGVLLVGHSDLSLSIGVLTNVSVVSINHAEALGDIIGSGCGGGEPDESD